MDNKEKDRHVSKVTIVNETPQSSALAKTDSKRDETENDDDDDDDDAEDNDDDDEYDEHDLYEGMICENLQFDVRKKRLLNDKGGKGDIKKKK